MDAIWQFEINITLFLQSLGTGLKPIFQFFTFLGTEEFYMFIMPAIYWCLDSKLGLRVAAMLMISNGVNGFIKTILHTPRPYWFDSRVNPLSTETSFGNPSGHAQNAASLWGLMASALRRGWAVILFIIIIFLIGLSRVYLGVHFTSDVLVGWLVGGLLLFAFIKLEKPVLAWLKQRTLFTTLGIAWFTSLFLIALILVGIMLSAEPSQTWLTNAELAGAEEMPSPLNPDGAFTLGGICLGLFAGAAWFIKRHGMFNTRGEVWQKIVRYIIGVAGVAVIYLGLGAIFPRTPDITGYFLRYFRYTLLGLWISLWAPLLFYRLKLARPTESSTH